MAEQESILRIKIDSRNAEKNANSLNKELQSIEKNGDFASKSMDSMSVATRQLAGYMAGIVTVGAAINKIDMYTNLNNRLKLVTTNQTELNMAMSDTFAIAQKSYQAWDSVVQVYQRFSDNAKTLGINMQQTAQLTETVSKAVAISGASTQAAEATLTQFGQALASGVLRGEELNSILEQTPALAKAIAQGMGITVGQLRSVAAEGKITGDVLVKALTKSKQSVDELFSRTDITIGQSITLLSNEVTKFTGEAGKASGAASFMAEAIKTLSQNLDLIANIAIVGGVALLTKAIATQTAALYASIGATIKKREADAAAIQSQIQLAGLEVQRTRQVQALALTELNLARQELNSATTRQERAAATMRLTQAEIAHNIALKQTATSVSALNVVESQLNKTRSLGAAALGLVGGPIGAITLGVTALAAGYMLLSGNSDKSTQSLRENNEAVGDAIKAYQQLNQVQQAGQMVEEKNKLSELEKAYEQTNNALKNYSLGLSNHNEIVTQSDVELSRLAQQYQDGKITLEQFTTSVQNSSKISQDAKDKVALMARSVNDAGSAAREQKTFIDQLSGSLNNAGNAGDNAASGIRNAAKATEEYTATLNKRLWGEQFKNELITKYNKSQNEANLLLEAYNENAKKGYSGVTEEQKKAIRGIESQRVAMEKRAQAERDAAKTSKKTESDAARKAKQAREQAKREADQLAKDQLQLRENIASSFETDFESINRSQAKALEDIQKANFNAADVKKYTELVNNSYDAQRAEYFKNLNLELNQYKWTEEKKLEYAYEANLEIEQNSIATNGVVKEGRIKFLKEQYDLELANIKLAKEQRIFQAEQGMYTEMGLIQKKYDLELKEIAKVKDANERSRLEQAAAFNKKKAESDLQINTTIAYNAAIGVDDSQERAMIDRQKAIDAMYENGFIKQQEYEMRSKQSREQYNRDMMSLQVGYGEQITGSMATMFKAMSGEQSRGYQVMYSISRGFAAAQAAISMVTNIAKASEVGFPQNIPMIAGAMAQGASIIAMLSGAQEPQGFATGGLVRGAGTGTSDSIDARLSNGEFVMTAAATRRVGVDTLNAINNGSTIQAERQAQANAKTQSQSPQIIDNQLRVIMVKDESEAKENLYGPDGEKAFLYHYKRNKSKLGA